MLLENFITVDCTNYLENVTEEINFVFKFLF